MGSWDILQVGLERLPWVTYKVTANQIYAKVDPRLDKDKNKVLMPDNIVNEKFMTEYQMKEIIPAYQPPSVWLPHGILEVQNTEIVKIPKESLDLLQDNVWSAAGDKV